MARAEDEIFLDEGGRFGGVGLYRAARVLAMVLIVLIVVSLSLSFLLVATGITFAP